MRHRVAGRKFDLPSDQRMALLKGLVRSLLLHDAIETTETRAKEVRCIAEKLITLAKTDSVHTRRQARKLLPAPQVPAGTLSASKKRQEEIRKDLQAADPVFRLFTVVGPKFAERSGGYTRMTKIGFRRGDAAPMVKLELATED